jgi:predicted ABC-type ATPase
VKENVLHVHCEADSYLAADIAEFIRQQLLLHEISFTYETVMSHSDKIAFLQKAEEKGYRVYLYYIATEDPEINISRVNIRVAEHGHNVAPEAVRNRYYKSLKQLKTAIKLSNRAYIWDNSREATLLFAEITEGEEVEIFDRENVPAWFIKYVLDNL